MSIYSTRKSKNQKTGPSGALKGGHFRNCQHFVAVERWTLWRKTNFRNKFSQCRKTEKGDPLGFLNIQSVPKHQKIEGGNFYFRKKSLAVPKILKRGPFGIFQHPSVAKHQKIEWGTLFLKRKYRIAEKK